MKEMNAERRKIVIDKNKISKEKWKTHTHTKRYELG